jgi:predicted amidohydrolase YtcJ
MAADITADSVDHLNDTRPDELERLAGTGVVAAVMPLIASNGPVSSGRYPIPAAALRPSV